MRARIKNLFGNLAIYGLGDVATSLISLLLLPVFTRYLSPADYGVITMLLTIEAVMKIVFRWGVDTAFIRLYYDCADREGRQRLASTLFLFLLALNGTILLLAVLSAEWLSDLVFSTPEHGALIALTIANIFVAGFFFIPLQRLRIEQKSRTYIALTFVRSSGTVIARLLLVIWAGLGVFGVVLADLIVTAIFSGILTFWAAPLLRPVFSRAVIREALGFGLPRVPHSVAHQVISVADRYFLKHFAGLSAVGLYSIGASFGLVLKLFLSAFEAAWTPFFLGTMREPDARRIYSGMSTYVVALLVLLVSGLCVTAPGVVRLFTAEEFHGAAAVTPWIALGVLFQGLYLIGSIGLVITKSTKYYPLATGTAAAVSLLANALLIPRFGMLGAAWAQMLSYAVLAAVTVSFSYSVYPIPYEWSRLARIAVAGLASFLMATFIVPAELPVVAWIAVAGTITVGSYAAVLAATGFFHPREMRVLHDLRGRFLVRRRPKVMPVPESVEMVGDLVPAPPETPDAGTLAQASAGSDEPVSLDSRSRRR